MRRHLVLVLLLFALPLLLSAQVDEVEERTLFPVSLSPSNEVPPVTGLEASGSGEIAILVRRAAPADVDDEDGGEDVVEGEILSAVVDFVITYTLGQPEELTAMHIHNAPRGQNGGIVIRSGLDFGGPSIMAETGTGSIFRQAEINDAATLAVVEAILANPEDYYVNIHSASNPSGLIRGQLREPQLPPGETGAQLDRIESKVDQALSDLQRIKLRLGIPN